MTDTQYGDRALGGSVKINDDVNAGDAYYKLMNLRHFGLGDLSSGLGQVSQIGGQVAVIANQVAPGSHKVEKAQQAFGLAGQIGDMAGQFSGKRIILLI